MSKVRDGFWIWGQNPGSHHGNDNTYNLPGKNEMETKEGCDFLGIDRCCRVAMGAGPFPPFDEEAEKIKNLKEVVWSAIGAGGLTQHNNDQSDLDEVLRTAEIYPNITGSVLDDFFLSVEFEGKDIARHSVASIADMRERLHSFPKRKLDLWLVWYTYQLDFKVQEYIDLCDVITMWTWKGSDLNDLDANIEKLLAKTPEKRRLAGCYMWNYGEQKPLTIDEMKFQCEKYLDWMRKGWIEGIVFCSNCIADLGLDTVEWTQNWIAEVGDEELMKAVNERESPPKPMEP